MTQQTEAPSLEDYDALAESQLPKKVIAYDHLACIVQPFRNAIRDLIKRVRRAEFEQEASFLQYKLCKEKLQTVEAEYAKLRYDMDRETLDATGEADSEKEA